MFTDDEIREAVFKELILRRRQAIRESWNNDPRLPALAAMYGSRLQDGLPIAPIRKGKRTWPSLHTHGKG